MEKEGPQRRVRTKFTPEQIRKLEKIFNKHKYLDAGERVKTAQKLSLTETQVRGHSQRKRRGLTAFYACVRIFCSSSSLLSLLWFCLR